MPELPEVQTVVNDLQSLVGAHIDRATLFWPNCAPPDFCKKICGQTIGQIHREGKYICIQLTDLYLLVHLRMSGRLLLDPSEATSRHERARIYLKDGQILKFIDQRKFGRLSLMEELQINLGVDPLSPHFKPAILVGRNKKIKTLLLDQTIIAGIGNIYADEALWEAQIHPEKTSISNQEAKALHFAIIKVLKGAIEHRGTSLGTLESNFHGATGERGTNLQHLKVYHRTGQPCPRCTTPITRTRLNGRSTHFCPRCQNR